MNSARISAQVDERGIGRLRMQDEARKNVFSDDFIQDLIAGLDQIEKDGRAKVLILSGLPDVFCGGADQKNLLDLADGKVHVKDLLISERLVAAPIPVIAAMEGHAVGGGLMLAVCSDIVIAAQESRYGAVFMSLGFTPGMGCTRLLADLVGPYAAAEMMFTAKSYKGRELAALGTHINYILPKAEVAAKAEALAQSISEKNLKSIRLLKQSLSVTRKKMLAEARIEEDRMHRESFAYPETRKAIQEMYGK